MISTGNTAVLLALGDRAASDGIGSVILSALAALGAMLLIYAVLVIMERVNKKKAPKEDKHIEAPDKKEKEFSEVLSKELEKRKNDDDMRI